MVKSRAFLADFFRRDDLEKPLMAVEGWDEDSGEWVYDRDIYSSDTGEWLPDDDGNSQKPTNWKMVERFREDHLSVSEAKDTRMITVSVKHFSPVAARQWAEWLVRDINEAEASIAYLEETNIASMPQVFYQLIENETRTVMLANAQKEYVFKTVDPAVVAEEKAEPKRALICIIAALLGGMLGVFIVFIRTFIGSGQDNARTRHEACKTAVQ